MAVTVQTITPAVYDPSLDNMPDFQLLAAAIGGNVGAAARVVKDAVDFLVQARSTAAESGAVLELLTARGVPFPAGFLRTVEVDAYISGDATDETGFMRYVFTISGGTTPLVRAGTLITSSPVMGAAGAVYQATAAAGFSGTSTNFLTIAAGAGTVTLSVTSGESEILNWTLRVKVGRLIPFLAGI